MATYEERMGGVTVAMWLHMRGGFVAVPNTERGTQGSNPDISQKS